GAVAEHALATELLQGSTLVPALVDVVARSGGAGAARCLLTGYLGAASAGQALSLQQALVRLPGDAVREALAIAAMPAAAAQVRAAELLLAMPDPANTQLLLRLLQWSSTPRAALAATEALLAAGESPGALAPRVPAPVLEMAL